MHVWRPKDSLGDSSVSYHVGPSDQAQVIRLMPPPLLVTWLGFIIVTCGRTAEGYLRGCGLMGSTEEMYLLP